MQWKIPAIIVLLLLTGCTRVLKPEPPPAFAGALIRVWCPPKAADLVRAQMPAWQTRQQASVEFVAQPDSADLWILSPADVARFSGCPVVPDQLTARGERFDWNGLLPLYREQLCRLDASIVAVPLVGEALVCVYRADLFTKHQDKYAAWREVTKRTFLPLRAPLSWTEFRDQAAYFAIVLGRPSLPPLPTDADQLDRLFFAIAAPHARRAIRADEDEGPDHLDEVFYFHYDRKTGQPRLDSPGFVYSLELWRDLKKYAAPKNIRAANISDPATALAEGQAVLGLIEAGELAVLQRSKVFRDKFNVCAIPGADRFWDNTGKAHPQGGSINVVPYLGGAGFLAAVSPRAAQAEAAWDLLADLAGPMRAAQIALEPRWGGGPTRSEQLLRDRWDSFGLDAARSQQLREAVGRTTLQHGIKNPVLVLRMADQAARREAVVRVIQQESGTPKEALQEAVIEWQRLDEKLGKGRALSEYKRSLGLTD